MAEKMKKRYRNASFKFHPFSKKQKQVLSWWEREELKEKDAIICDGSVRAEKQSLCLCPTSFGQCPLLMVNNSVWQVKRLDR